MNKPANIAIALVLAMATGAVSAQTVNNWRTPYNEPVKNPFGLCWRNAFWTPDTGIQGCDGVPVPPPPARQAVAPTPPPAYTPPPPVVAPTAQRVVLNADTFFDFDRSIIKPEGVQVLDQVVAQVQQLELETLIVTGHTDATGPDAYNLRLSERRANAVKNYLVSQGIPDDRVYVEGKGRTQPVASNATREGRAQNRRVELEVIGTRRR